MKKYLWLFVLMGCSNDIKYPLVVVKVSQIKGQKNYIEIGTPNYFFSKNKYFWTDSLYKVGDTIR